MPSVCLRPVPLAEKAEFTRHFQEYLRELSPLSGARPNRHGIFEYSQYNFYWEDPGRMPFFIESDGVRVGLAMLRELPASESEDGDDSFQLAEIYVFKAYRRRGIGAEVLRLAAAMAEERRLPLTWSAYMNNGPANALYRSILREFEAKDGLWRTRCTHGIDSTRLARYYYRMTPVAARQRA